MVNKEKIEKRNVVRERIKELEKKRKEKVVGDDERKVKCVKKKENVKDLTKLSSRKGVGGETIETVSDTFKIETKVRKMSTSMKVINSKMENIKKFKMGENLTYRPAIVNLMGSGEKVGRDENVTKLKTKLPPEPSTQSVNELATGGQVDK